MKVAESLVMQVSISSLQPTWISLSSSFSSANVCLGLFLNWNEQKEKKIVTTTQICEYAIPPIIGAGYGPAFLGEILVISHGTWNKTYAQSY